MTSGVATPFGASFGRIEVDFPARSFIIHFWGVLHPEIITQERPGRIIDNYLNPLGMVQSGHFIIILAGIDQKS